MSQISPGPDNHEAVVNSVRGGIPAKCEFCPAQRFRRSALKSKDIPRLFLMQYPVRCLRCSRRQYVSFHIAAVSIPSHVKQARSRKFSASSDLWIPPGKSGPHREPEHDTSASVNVRRRRKDSSLDRDPADVDRP